MIIVSIIMLTLLYYSGSVFHTGLTFPCLLKTLTGWKCWGCGGQHAFHELLHGNYRNAFELNALVFPVLLLFAYISAAELMQKTPDYSWLRSRKVRTIIAVLVLSFTVLRNF